MAVVDARTEEAQVYYHASPMSVRPSFRRPRVRVALTAFLLALAATSVVFAAAALRPQAARADSTELSILMDDQPLLYTSNSAALSALERLKSIGVNVVRVSVVWALLAPNPTSTRTPKGFNASDPGSYPYGAWARYDYLDEVAHRLGMTLYFDLTAPAPAWAVAHDPTPNVGHSWSYKPNISDYEQFVQAVGTRYSGDYTTTTTSCKPSNTVTFGGIVIPIGPVKCTQVPKTTLPAIHWWSIWNEPDEVGWLTPQTHRDGGRTYLSTPAYYRRMADAAYTGLLGTGHLDDTILLGELTSALNSATTHPLPWMRDFYCVNGADQPLTGSAASVVGCPTSGNRVTFVQDNPVLFAASGFAYHPYSFIAPNRVVPGKPWAIDLENISGLNSTLTGVLNAYNEPDNMPIYITEFAYETKPPDPYAATSLANQAKWLNQAEYMTYNMPRVKSMAQFLLYDLPPLSTARKGTRTYWSPFQSGLLYLNGNKKPAYNAFRLPIWVPSAHTGSSVYVWGQIRPATFEGAQAGVLQFKRSGTSSWQYLSTVETTNPEGFLTTHVALHNRGQLRLEWTDAGSGDSYYSRSVSIS
jgi:hypothetical protein